MGVSGLLGLLKSIQKPCNLKDFAGKTLGVDAYGWLHRGAVACAVELATGQPTTKFVDFAMHRVRMLIHFGVTPYLVFDGDRLPSKAGTEKGRRDRRKESKAKGMELLSLGKSAQAYQELSKAVDVTPEMARQLIEALKQAQVEYVVAPYEADSQLAYLERQGLIDGILSEDSDLLVFGAKCLLTKLDQYGGCVMIRQADFAACREVNLTGWTPAEFRRMAILSGCDYLEGLHKMGLKTAHRMVRKYKTTDRVIGAIQLEGKTRVPADYMERFIQAEWTFLYQWVFCPRKACLVHLTQPEKEDQLAGISYIGQYVEANIAKKVASGDLNPMTKRTIIADPKWSQGLRMPRAGMKKVATPAPNGKAIDQFFKPKRTPLAELDPNSFTPSPSQQQLMQRPTRPWSAQRAPTAIPPQMSTPTEWQRDARRQRIASAPHPSKKPRLCADTAISPAKPQDASRKSRFFADSIQPSPSLGLFTRHKRRENAEINLWSDDSIDDAMAALPDLHQTLSSSKPKSRFAVFNEFTQSAAASVERVSKSLERIPQMKKPVPNVSRQSQSPVIASTLGLTSKFNYVAQNPGKAGTNEEKKQAELHDGPTNSDSTTPKKSTDSHNSPDTKLPISPAIIATPLKPILLDTGNHVPTFHGSEDVLLVPESDLESNHSSPMPATPTQSELESNLPRLTSPLSHFQYSSVVEHGDTDDRVRREIADSDDDSCSVSGGLAAIATTNGDGVLGTLELGKFVFAGRLA